MITKKVPKSGEKNSLAIRRLSTYHRTLAVLEQAGVEVTSSKELGDIEEISAAQVRKDLSVFGSFGRRGLGYGVSQLKAQITRILGINRMWNLVLIGTGQLSEVFINSEAFKRKNFCVRKIFDNALELIGEKIEGITAKGFGEYMEIKVEDTGVGIPPEELPKIFDKFYRVKYPKTRQISGTGLGLAIVKNVVEAHQGTIEVESVMDKGTIFKILLPVIL